MPSRFRIWLTVFCGLFLVLMFVSYRAYPAGTVWFAWGAAVFGAWFPLSAAWESVKARTLDVNILMVVAAGGALGMGHPEEAAILMFLFALSGTLEAYAMARTESAIEGLMKLRPETALVETDGETRTVGISDVRLGDVVRVLPFQNVPLDGQVVDGHSSVNEAAMTGESRPVEKGVGAAVIGGTENGEGTLLVRVERLSGESTLDKIVDLVRDAQENKASGERIAAWFGSRYTVIVIVASVMLWGIQMAMGATMEQALMAGLTLLVALSPCALVISTPASTLSALAWAGRSGLLVRGGAFIELAGQATTVFLDKTGTLTRGEFGLAEVCVCESLPVAVGAACGATGTCWHRGEPEPSELARWIMGRAAAVERESTHPVAAAITGVAERWGVGDLRASEVRVIPGIGIEGTVDGLRVAVAQMSYFEDLPDDMRAKVLSDAADGATVAVTRIEGPDGVQWAGLVMDDGVRPEAKASVEAFRRLGVRDVAMLTGDQEATAQGVARQTGVNRVYAALMPEDKERLVREAVERGETVIFVGDGVNDAPSLARAHVGAAMGGLGSDIALNAADVVVMNDRLDRIVDLVRLGRRTRRIIQANLIFAGCVIGVLTLIALFWGRIFPDRASWALPLAVVGHEGSTVLVILNGLRLLAGPGRG